MELDEKKTKYFVIGIVLLILLGIVLIVHFNNKSLVSGDKDKNSTTKKTTEVKTTEVTTTKKKNVVKQVNNSSEVVDNVTTNNNVYKSVIDDENKIVYNYKLSEEILDTDKLISKKLDINEYLKNNNVIGLYDISLYTNDNIKKNVSNSVINVSIPLTSELIGYDEYKVVYVNDSGVITDEVFDTSVSDGFIKFTTTHLSMYGIVGIKNNNDDNKQTEEVVDLTNVKVNLSLNNNIVSSNDRIIVSKDDIISVNVLNLDKEYKVYYALRSSDVNSVDTYNLYDSKIDVSGLEPTKKYNIIVKVVVGNTNAVFELNEINSYDIVYMNDGSKEETVGEIRDNENNEIDYNKVEENKDIAVKDITSEELENKAEINIKGNVYLVDKTDLSNLNITGYLYIDTDKEISTKDKKTIDMANIYKVTILSNKFTLNGVNYEYEVKEDGSIIITRVDGETRDIVYNKPATSEKTEETSETKVDSINEEQKEEVKEETDVKFEDNFSGSKDIEITVDEDKNLVIVNKEKEVTEVKEPEKEKVEEPVNEVDTIGE